jgi:hypothetical protein
MDAHKPLKEFFAGRRGPDQALHLPNVDFGLIHNIVEQQPSATVDSLVAFCRNPHNLRDFLPDPRDRSLFSRRLVEALLDYRGRRPSRLQRSA